MTKWKDVKRKEILRELGNTIHEPIMNFLFMGEMRKPYLLGIRHSGTGNTTEAKNPPACTQSCLLLEVT
jgi:hypothetical protein